MFGGAEGVGWCRVKSTRKPEMTAHPVHTQIHASSSSVVVREGWQLVQHGCR